MPRRRLARKLLDNAKAGLKSHLTRGHKSTSRAVDGEELAWQERANVTAMREREHEMASRDMEQATEVLTRLATIDEARECWWYQTDDSPDRQAEPEPEPKRAGNKNTHIHVYNKNGYDVIDSRIFFDGGKDIHSRRFPDSW